MLLCLNSLNQNLFLNTNKQWFGETMSGIEADIETLQAQKLE